MMLLNLSLIAAFLTIGLAAGAEVHWGYPNLDADEAFPTWGGLCDSGRRQSPIDLSLKGSLKGVYDKFEFDNFDDAQHDIAMVNNGHTIQLSAFPYEMKLEGGPLIGEYIVEQIHMHWWSEHTIDNVRFSLEAHIVHRSKQYANMTMAAEHKDGIVVIAILYHVSNRENDAIGQIIENLDQIKSYKQLNKPARMRKNFIVRDLFPDINGYMTYAGSLTTPSCAESVTWIVLTETFPVTQEQVNKFREIEIDEDKKLTNNYRNIQKTNNRPIIAVLFDEDDGRKGGAASTTLHMQLGTLLMVVIFTKFLQ